MATLAAPAPTVFERVATLAAQLFRLLPAYAPAPEDCEETRARIDFVQEMLGRNPDAFSSDLDVQAMMQHYPGSF